MSKEPDNVTVYDKLTPSSELYLPLITEQEGRNSYVESAPVNHKDLDHLIGRLMQMFDLNGDVEQRKAQKSQTKMVCREWLDNIYNDKCAYNKKPGSQLKTVMLDKYIFE